MNITEYAREYGTSTTTIYRKLQDAGIKPDGLKDDKGQLTEDGIKVLSGIMHGTPQRPKQAQPDDTTNGTETVTGYLAQISSLEHQLEAARTDLTTANARIRELQAQIQDMTAKALERERANAEAWKEYAQKQQQIEAQRLTGGKGFFHRLFGRKTDSAE